MGVPSFLSYTSEENSKAEAERFFIKTPQDYRLTETHSRKMRCEMLEDQTLQEKQNQVKSVTWSAKQRKSIQVPFSQYQVLTNYVVLEKQNAIDLRNLKAIDITSTLQIVQQNTPKQGTYTVTPRFHFS